MPNRLELSKANVLVVGGAGFIGSHLADALLDAGVSRLVILDNFFLGKPENIKGAIERGAVLVRDDAELNGVLDYVVKDYAIDVVFDCATRALNYSFVNPRHAFMTNVNVTERLLELLRLGGYHTLCHFSSSEVYGTAVYEPMDEKHPMFPTTTYAAGKAAADMLLEAYVKQYKLDAFIVRPFNNYGPRQNYEGALAGIIPRTAYHLYQGGKPEIHGTGEQTRDFIYVTDTVKMVLAMYGALEAGESVNISSRHQVSMKRLIQDVCGLMGYSGEILYCPRRNADVDCHNATNQKLLSLTAFEPMTFEDGLKATVDWYLKCFEEKGLSRK